ncbi:MAG: UDP-N-acetylglucosamine-1-phosphate transferase [Candidatus Thermoplasmatota archaeon]|nr:UDP-N-acetylglucosamine-1-phosphate transferase [Euryarchaeota archaeon]MBU4031422.1 UDP-N-acetylglucosamine-1-phosphate transferase [Candidatus Thermoplasmatota archaeon]MBU4071026.1 UDP-N-acetylglucosamine-1-phosphate transferase [Candidatus Thermoplasmatota archaeon]MBU4144692.1 UDP-N-acetylglucosamine-1-phosphate transferase [Candidatus Thermoplasmatota archaeon]MBU4591049.1 UDP-N-acetylglucosamine-1-phosphate transferase [Candidatus Thermoplasmatota archaeon]
MWELPIAVTLLFSLAITGLAAPWFIRKMREKNQTVKDYYKPDKTQLANNGGILTLFAVFTTIIVVPLVFRILFKFEMDFPREFTELDTAILMVILLYAFYGVLDDYIDVGRASKILLPLMFAYPLVIALSGWSPWVPFVGETSLEAFNIGIPGLGTLSGSMILRYAIIPIYIMVVANLKNMHSGFNGLQSGSALIILSFILLKSWIDSNLENMYTIAALIGAQAVFFWYNKYPSKILEGNIGSLAVGGAIGAALVVQHYLFAGVVMLIPHIINFLMYVYWRLMNKRHPEDPKYTIAKFGKVREDGTLEVPNRFTLKWLLPYYFRMTEKQVVYSMYIMTLAFCVLGFFVPG